MLQEVTLRSSGEWAPRQHSWFVVRVAEGTGYWLQPGAAARQLGAGDGLMTTGNSKGILRASQLGELKLQFFVNEPQYLNGLLTVAEWHQVENLQQKPVPPVSFFAADQPLAQRFTRLAEQPRREGLPLRCGLLQLWANAIAELLPPPALEPPGSNKLRERFQQLVGRMPEAELSQRTLRDLAGQLNCSERHFTRLFRESFGVPFRTRQIELRLQRARQLLADSNAKIINVAFDSGYHHLGLFNLMFKKRFGMTPSEWRQQSLRRKAFPPSSGHWARSAARWSVGLLLLICGSLLPARAQINSTPIGRPVTNAVAATTRFNIRAYAIHGNPALPATELGVICSPYTGTNLNLEDIGRAVSAVQAEYRRQGYATLSFAVAPLQITNGQVTIHVFQAASPQILIAGQRYVGPGPGAGAGANSAAAETVLPALQAGPAPIVPPAADAVPAPTVHPVTVADADELARARIALLQKLDELAAKDQDTRVHVVSTNPGPRFEVNQYLVRGNTALPPEAITRALTNVDGAFGTNVSFDGIRAALTEVRGAYRERGYVTVDVRLPPQKLTNGTVKVQVIEGRLAAINVIGNHYYSSNNVRRALPSLRTNALLNSHILQSELDAANANRNRQIYPVVGPGPEPGTSELTLKVKDRLPWHARLELNNSGTPGTPDLRFNFNSQYDNLWGLDHQVGVQYSFSPEQMKNENDYVNSPFDDPLVANYSGYYRLPLGSDNPVQQQVEANPGSFGYNEATHKFNLPPATGRPELNFYASRSTEDTGVQYGPLENVVTTPLLKIDSRTSGDNVTLNEGAGARFTLPLPQVATVSGSLSLGVDYKRYQQVSYNTNNFYVAIVVTNSAGQPVTIKNTVASGQPPQRTTLIYVPLNFGWNATIPDDLGKTFFHSQVNFNPFKGPSDDAEFGKASYTTNAQAGYVTLQMSMDRVQNIYHDWSVKLHADGQWANGALISNEQYGMGGMAGVRGYQDGFAYGDEGWRFSIEPQTPLFKVGMVGNDKYEAPCWVRASAFLDYGRLYDLEVPAGVASSINFCGIGFGCTVNLGPHLDGRLTVAWPLIDHPDQSPYRIYFGVGAQF